MKRARFERVHQAIGAEEHLFVRCVVEEHRDYGVCAELGFCRGACGDRAFAEQWLRAPLGSVPHRQFVAGGKQAQRHRRSHLAETQKSNLHFESPIKEYHGDSFQAACGWPLN